VWQRLADRVGLLEQGRRVGEARPDDLVADPKHPATQLLLEAAPRMDAFGREATLPEGEIPDPINPPSGCAFHPRCPIATDICKQDRPPMRPLGNTRVACHLAQ